MDLYCRESSDYGASFGAKVTVHSATGSDRIESVAAAVQGNGEPIAFFSKGDPNGNDTELYVVKRSGGAWGSPSSWGKGQVHRIKGVTVVYISGSTDYNILLGLCVGHDSLFIKYSEAMVTVLVAKDRVFGHNPAAGLYLSGSYYKKLMRKEPLE